MRRHILPLLLGFGLLFSGRNFAAPPPQPELLPPLIGTVSGGTTGLGDLRWLAGGANLLRNGGFEGAFDSAWQASTSAGGEWTRASSADGGDPLYANGPAVFRRTLLSAPATTVWRAELVQTVNLPESVSLILAWDDLRARLSSSPAATRTGYRVEVRDLEDATLFTVLTVPIANTPRAWIRRSADLTPWAGRTVKLAWVVMAFDAPGDLLALDNLRLEAAPTDGLSFDVFFGPRTNFAANNLLARTTALNFAPPATTNGVTNYYRIVAVQGVETNASELGQFRRPSANVQRQLYLTDTNPVVRLVGRPFELSVFAAADPARAPSGSGSFTLKAFAEDAAQPTVLLTELDFGPASGVEVMNVSAEPQDISGWTVYFADRSTSQFSRSLKIPAGTVLASGAVVVVREGGGSPGAAPDFSLGSDLNWSSPPVMGAAALTRHGPTSDLRPLLVDIVLLGSLSTDAFTGVSGGFSGTTGASLFPAFQWLGEGLTGHAGAVGARRVVNRDTHGVADWRMIYGPGDADFGAANPELIGLWRPGPGELAVATSRPTTLVNGRWQGQVTLLPGTARNAWLQATLAIQADARDSVAWPAFQVQTAPRVSLVLPATVDEGAASATASVRLQSVAAQEVTVTLTANPAGRLNLPAAVTIPAGRSDMEFTVSVLDNATFEGPVEVTLTPAAADWESVPGSFLVLDDETASLALELPGALPEGSAGTGTVRLGTASAFPVQVELSADNPELLLPARVSIPPGATSTSFTVRRYDDPFVDGELQARLTARLAPAPAVPAELTLSDNESFALNFAAPTPFSGTAEYPIVEGATTTSRGSIRLGGLSRIGRTVRLTTSDANRLLLRGANGVPAADLTVQIKPGSNSATFDVVAPDNELREGRQTVTLRAESEGFTPAALNLVIADNDPAQIVFNPLESPQYQGATFYTSWRALTLDGDETTVPSQPVSWKIQTLTADGAVTASSEPAGEIVAGLLGQSAVPVTIGDAGSKLRLRLTAGALTGDSEPFNVLAPSPTVTALTNAIAMAVDRTRGEVVALVLSPDRTAPAELRALNPDTGGNHLVATTPAAPGPYPETGRMAVSQDGLHVFVIGGDPQRFLWVFRRVDGQLVAQRQLTNDSRISNLVAALPGAGENWRAFTLDNRGLFLAHTSLLDPSAALLGSTYGLVASEDGRRIFGTPSTTAFATVAELVVDAAGQLNFRENLWTMTGISGSPVTQAGLGSEIINIYGGGLDFTTGRLRPDFLPHYSFLNVLLAPDPTRDELLFALPYGSRTIVSAYDRETRLPTREAAIFPGSVPQQFAVVSSRWAVLLGDHAGFPRGDRLEFVPLPLPLLEAATADLKLAVESITPNPVTGRESRWRVRVTNSGPGAASDVRVEQLGTVSWNFPDSRSPRPGESTVRQSTAVLPAGESHEFTFSATPSVAGPLQLRFNTFANEVDPVVTNNAWEDTVTVGLDVPANAIGEVARAVHSLAWDGNRRQLLALGGNLNGDAGQLLSFDGDQFRSSLLRELPGYPRKLVLSDDARYAYVGLARSVLRMDLAGEEPDLTIPLPAAPTDAYALQTVVAIPGSPRSVAVSWFETNGPPGEVMRWPLRLGVFDDAQLRPRAPTPDWEIPEYVRKNYLDAEGMLLDYHIFAAARGVEIAATLWGPIGLHRFTIGPDGLSLNRPSDDLSMGRLNRSFLWIGDALYAADAVNDARSGRPLPRLLETKGGALAWDAESDKIIVLTGQYDTDQRPGLNVIVRNTGALIGALEPPLFRELSFVRQTVRLDGDRVAFIASHTEPYYGPAGKNPRLFIGRTDLLAHSGPVADLSVAAKLEPAPLRQGDLFSFRLTITNAGPDPASNVVISLNRSEWVKLVASVPRAVDRFRPIKDSLEQDRQSLWNLPALASGAAAEFTATFHSEISGPVTLLVGVSAATPDRTPTNNTVSLTLPVAFPAEGTARIQGSFVAAVFDSVRGQLLLSGSPQSPLWADRVVALNPVTGAVEREFDLGFSPGLMALTEDQRHLWVETGRGRRVQRLNLESGAVDLAFTPENAPAVGEPSLPAGVLLAYPGDAAAVGLIRGGTYPVPFGLYRDGLLTKPETGIVGTAFKLPPPFPLPAFAPDGALLVPDGFGQNGVTRWEAGPGGFTPLAPVSVPVDDQFKADGKLFFTGGGVRVNPFTLETAAPPFDPFLPALALAVDEAEGRVWNWSRTPADAPVLVWRDAATGQQLGQQPLEPPFNRTALDLLRVGGNRLAALYPGYLDVFPTSGVATAPAVDLRVTLAPMQIPGPGQLDFAFTASVENRGPNPANNVVLNITIPAGISALQSEPAAVFDEQFHRQFHAVGTLVPGATFTATVRGTAAGEGALLQAVVAAGSDARELFPDDNSDRVEIIVPWMLDAFRPAPMFAAHIAWSRWTQRLYLAGQEGATVFEFDPRTGTVTGEIPAFAVVDVVVSDDGRRLYVANRGENSVRRYPLPLLRPDLKLLPTAGVDDDFLLEVVRATPLSGTPNGVAVLLNDGRLRIFDGEQARPLLSKEKFLLSAHHPLLSDGEGTAVFLFAGDAVRRFEVGPAGATNGPQHTFPFFGMPAFARLNDRLIMGNGDILRTGNLESIGRIEASGTVAADELGGTVTFASVNDPFAMLRHLRFNDGTLLGSDQFQVGQGNYPQRLLRWGADGLAMLAGHRLFLARLSYLAPPAGQDSDGDGLTDDAELAIGLNPAVSDAVTDLDGDGISNTVELAAGTDPRDALSPLRLTAAEMSATGVLEVRFPTDRNRRFVLETAPAPNGPWTEFGHPVNGAGGVQTVTVTAASETVFVRLQTNR